MCFFENCCFNYYCYYFRQVVTRKPVVKKLEQKAKVEAVKLLDSKRSQNVGILAQSLRADMHEIENAIYNFDTSIVSLETLQQIYEVVSKALTLIVVNKDNGQSTIIY